MSKLKKVVVSLVVFTAVICLFSAFAYADQATSKTGIINEDNVNLRETPSTDAKVLTKFQKGTQVSVTGASEDWYKVSYEGVTGWVFSQFVSIKASSTTLGTGTVNAEILNVRSEPNTTSNILAKLKINDKVTLISKSDDWYKIKTDDGVVGWVAAQYITIKGKTTTSRGGEIDRSTALDEDNADEDTQTDTTTGKDLVEFAKQYLGYKYVYGCESPSTGFDCSGFTYYVFGHFGIKLERTAANQATQGIKVKKANLRPGDLLFFDSNGGHNNITHVGIYIGDGKFIHSSTPKTGVIISDLNSDYYINAYMTARRVIK